MAVEKGGSETTYPCSSMIAIYLIGIWAMEKTDSGSSMME
jgi:hypothetical protein